MSDRLPVFLPVEIKTRELDAMILLACVLAEQGHSVYLGDRDRLKPLAHRLPRGIYLGKSVTGDMEKFYRHLRQLGHTVTALDEEGLVIYSPEIYKTRRVGAGTLQQPQALFAWGEANATLWRDYFGSREGGKIHVTGNPRFDLFRSPLRELYRKQAQNLRDRYGPYLLFNSNFHWVNTRKAAATRLPSPADVASGKFPTPKFYNPDLARYRIALFRAYLEALPELAASFPELQFILRPHPAESSFPWQQATAHLNNCHVIYEGEVTPWILGSQAVLHHSCTTAVESFVLGKSVICYRPLRDEALDPPLPIQLSLEVASVNELKDTLAAVLKEETDLKARTAQGEVLKRHLAAAEGPLACDRIARIFKALPPQTASLGERLAGRMRIARKQIKRQMKGKSKQRMFADLYPPTPVAYVEAQTKSFSRLLNRFHSVAVTELETNLYRIQDVER
ncbi:surface carbohydrate biosynthesis protein [Methylohalobius crimeensis]|uniref:surface carbohydrate biosynthesis protein n=1 Tax=Methylohalobius crimeensis TaxID=244365 RepID=UPI0003B77687|nr:surface carbohydrate biosynthesis protein [Methylohalobius crimeensis]